MGDQTISMNYYSMELMAKAFKEGAQSLAEMEAKVKEIAGQLENGALQGKAGEALRDSLRDNLASRIVKMKEKFEELEKNINEAVHEMQNADEISGGYYKG